MSTVLERKQDGDSKEGWEEWRMEDSAENARPIRERME